MLEHNDKPHVTIKPGGRTLVIPSETKIIGVAGDADAERINFDLPRWYDGNDLGSKTWYIDVRNPAGRYAAPALWAPYHATDRAHALPWIAPTGAQDAYNAGRVDDLDGRRGLQVQAKRDGARARRTPGGVGARNRGKCNVISKRPEKATV